MIVFQIELSWRLVASEESQIDCGKIVHSKACVGVLTTKKPPTMAIMAKIAVCFFNILRL